MSQHVKILEPSSGEAEPALLAKPGLPASAQLEGAERPEEAGPALDLVVDGRKVVITAANEIELRCGKAVIRLTEDGKVIIRGTNIVSRASGQNRIKGGSVHIN